LIVTIYSDSINLFTEFLQRSKIAAGVGVCSIEILPAQHIAKTVEESRPLELLIAAISPILPLIRSYACSRHINRIITEGEKEQKAAGDFMPGIPTCSLQE
jgi:hypothetical protein